MPQILLKLSSDRFLNSSIVSPHSPLEGAAFLNPQLASPQDYTQILDQITRRHAHWRTAVEYLRMPNLILGNTGQSYGVGFGVPALHLSELLDIFSGSLPLSSPSHIQAADNTTASIISTISRRHLRINPSAKSLIAAYERG